MMLTQDYHYTRRILTLQEVVSELGTVNFAVARYACGQWYTSHGITAPV